MPSKNTKHQAVFPCVTLPLTQSLTFEFLARDAVDQRVVIFPIRVDHPPQPSFEREAEPLVQRCDGSLKL